VNNQRSAAKIIFFVEIAIVSRLTGSESQGQEEAACVGMAQLTRLPVLFTAIPGNAVIFPSDVT